jgi:hypothetical protein
MADHYHDLAPEHEHFPPELDRKCIKCNGHGSVAVNCITSKKCDRCDGNGYTLTSHGRELLRFLQRHPPTLTRVGKDS